MRKPIASVKTIYACQDCGHTIEAMPLQMQVRQFCPACCGTMWKSKGPAPVGGGVNPYERPMIKPKGN